jgi:hypothetical protein
MARYVMVLRGATSLRGALEGVGPENLDFFGPKWHSRKQSTEKVNTVLEGKHSTEEVNHSAGR